MVERDDATPSLNTMDENSAVQSGTPEEMQAVTSQDAPGEVTDTFNPASGWLPLSH